jgi:UPF0755 protein
MAKRRRKSQKKEELRREGLLLGVLLIAVLAAGGAAWVVLAPFGPGAETFVDLAPGSSTARIGRQLEAAGIIRTQVAFDLLRFWKRGTLRAGEYRFEHPASALEVYSRIARGDVFTRTLTVPEGSSIFEIATRVEEAGFDTRQHFS